MTAFLKVFLVGMAAVSALPICAATLGISGDGRHFTINGVPTFLNGISYYAGTSANSDFVRKDVDDIRAAKMNWIRVWTHWDGGEGNFSVTTPDGEIREPYMGRLKNIIEECSKREIIVDVSMHRGKEPVPSNIAQHLACAKTLAKVLKPYRNVYIDIANERDVGDARFVSFEEMGELITAIKAIDPDRICTASSWPGSKDSMDNHLRVGKVDFIAPHLCRDPECPAKTLGTVQELIGYMKELGRRVPIHLQEPFRRGYTGGWEPGVEDYYRDCTGGKIADAAGWCLHNGSTRSSADHKPQRSFRMTDEDGRLFDQLDFVEKRAARGMDEQIGGVSLRVMRYQAEYDEQVSHQTGRKDRFAWRAEPGTDKVGLLAAVTTAELPVGKHRVTWRLMLEGDCAADAVLATIEVRFGDKALATRKLLRRDFKTLGTWQEFPLDVGTGKAGPLELRTDWAGNCAARIDHISLNTD